MEGTVGSAALLPVTQTVEFDTALIRKLSQLGPRYTSYPTADRFNAEFGYRDDLQAVTGATARGNMHPLSLYIHIPFCESICYYCGCNKIVTKDRSKAANYLIYLKREIEMQGKLLAGANQVEQLHFGGGTPTYLSDAQMGELMQHLRRWFNFAPDAEGEYSGARAQPAAPGLQSHQPRGAGLRRRSAESGEPHPAGK
jgi:oxygen-independent coproporphyrinogen-3 oxidase